MDQERAGIYIVGRKTMRNKIDGKVIVSPEIDKELEEYLNACDTVTSEYSYIKETEDA